MNKKVLISLLLITLITGCNCVCDSNQVRPVIIIDLNNAIAWTNGTHYRYVNGTVKEIPVFSISKSTGQITWNPNISSKINKILRGEIEMKFDIILQEGEYYEIIERHLPFFFWLGEKNYTYSGKLTKIDLRRGTIYLDDYEIYYDEIISIKKLKNRGELLALMYG